MFSWNSVRSLGDIFGFIIFWNSAFLELQRRVSKGRIRKMTNLRICTVGLDHNWWFLTTFLMIFLWFSWFIAPETDSKKITKIIGILPNALELGCQKLSKKCTGINLRGKAGSRTNPEVFKIHRCLCFRVCMGQCCQRLVIKFLSRGVSLLLAAYHSQKLAQKAVGRASCHYNVISRGFPLIWQETGFECVQSDTARVSSVFNPIEIWRQFRLSLHYDFHFLNKHTAKVWKLEKKTCFFVFFMKNNYENTVSIPIGIKNTIFPKPENSIENGHQNTVNWWLDRFETLKMKASGWFRALCETCFLNEWS